jgi:Zn-dependent peptidase ImmA (M78 family)
MTEFEDYHVSGRSNDELERAADELRAQLGFALDEIPSARQIMDRANAKLGVEVVVQPDTEMGRKEAYATSAPPRIFLRQSVFDACERDDPRARMTILHELSHIVLHPGAPKARMATARQAKLSIRPFNSAEHQAGVMAAAFLIPREIAQRASSVQQLQIACRVSAQAAGIRFSQCRPKQELTFVRAEIERLERATAVADERQNTQDREDMIAWERSAHIPNEDPMSYRKSADGYRIKRSDLRNRNSQCGWFVRDGRTYAYFGEGNVN